MASTGNYEKGLAAYKSGDYATALRKFRPLAKQGLASAQSSLGWMYYGGQGVTQNDKTAVKWYRLAAEQGDAPAQYSLGVMYENGLGVPQDDKTALKWFTLSAKGKNEYAQSEVNRLQKKIAKTETAPPSKTGNYQKGQAAYEKGDYATALREFKPLAKQGDASAQNNLGLIYRHGKGVTQNDKTAIKWFRLAAKQGHASAQYNLGWVYHQGKGVTQDDKTALKWLTLAAEQGVTDDYTQSEVNRLQKKIAKTETTSSKKSKKKSKQPSVSIADDDPFKIPSFLDRTGDSPPPVQEVSPPAPEKKSAKPEEVSPPAPEKKSAKPEEASPPAPEEKSKVRKFLEKGDLYGKLAKKATKALGPVGLGLTAYELLGAEAKAGERINKEAAQILIDAGLAVPELVADVLKQAFVPTEMGDATLKNVYEQEFKKPELSESREAVIVKKRPTGRLDFPTDNEKSFMSDW